MLEKDMENLIAAHPDEIFPGEGFRLLGQQVAVEGRRLDILFEDKHKRRIIVEVKRGILTREASGQIAEYYGLLKNADNEGTYELVLCANVIPGERKTFLERIGIECKELGLLRITQLATKYDYRFADDQPASSESTTKDICGLEQGQAPASPPLEEGQDISVWIFQADPNRYDILNALDDGDIGNTIHWRVRHYRHRIHKGHLGLVWMSGKEAGIYAMSRIECEPHPLAETEAEKKYWLEDSENEIETRVRLSILKRLVNKPVLKSTLREFPELSRLSILTHSQGTNFPVRDSEWRIISQLI
jgi:hypothetical protein